MNQLGCPQLLLLGSKAGQIPPLYVVFRGQGNFFTVILFFLYRLFLK